MTMGERRAVHLLPEDGAGEDGVVATFRRQVDLDWQLVLGVPDSRHLPGHECLRITGGTQHLVNVKHEEKTSL